MGYATYTVFSFLQPALRFYLEKKMDDSKQNNGDYRVNNEPNNVALDVAKFEHDFDPLSNTYDAISTSSLVKKIEEMTSVDTSFLLTIIVRFIGRSESTLECKSSLTFGCTPLDIEQLFFISLPKNSNWKYKIVSFACDIFLDKYSQFCATLCR